MLNPSTADEHRDDPTIRRCAGFTMAWGYSGFHVLNLFALRATDPRELVKHPEPVGLLNNLALGRSAAAGRLAIAAWGAASSLPGRMLAEREAVIRQLRPDGLICLGLTKDGHPRHPLYVRGDAELVRWPE
jgi:hypothetical protein